MIPLPPAAISWLTTIVSILSLILHVGKPTGGDSK